MKVTMYMQIKLLNTIYVHEWGKGEEIKKKKGF